MKTADDCRETLGAALFMIMLGAILYALYIGTP